MLTIDQRRFIILIVMLPLCPAEFESFHAKSNRNRARTVFDHSWLIHKNTT